MMSESETKKNVSSDFFEKYKNDIQIFSQLNDLIIKTGYAIEIIPEAMFEFF